MDVAITRIVHFCALAGAMAIGIAGCGGGSGGSNAPTYQIGGSVTGLLTGNTVVLLNNGGNQTPVSVNAGFSFSSQLPSGANYAITVSAQPQGESCTVANGTGKVANANVSVAVTCTANPYAVGGSVSGLLPGNQVGLTNNGSNGITVAANGTFIFSPPSLSGSAYAVTVFQQPIGQSCSVTNGVGSIAGNNVSNVAVVCSNLGYTVTANVFGLLANTSLILQDNGADNLAVSAIGTYTFKTSIPTRGNYAVTVLTQPSGQTCFTTNGSGSVVSSNVTVTVVCPWHVAYVTNGATSFYYIDPTTGALLPGSSAVTSGAFVSVAPNRKFAYVANESGISLYSIDIATGALTFVGTSPSSATNNPVTIAIDPSGRFLYAGNAGYVNLGQGPQDISGFTINLATGVLTPISGGMLPGILSPASMAVDSSGKFLLGSNGVYAIDQSTGALTIVAGSTGFGGLGPTSSALDSHGPFVYSLGSSSSGAFAFNAGTGQLTAIAGSTPLPSNATSIAVTPDGLHAYTINAGGVNATVVQAYSINQTSGALSPVVGGSYNITVNATTIAVDPSGLYVYISNYLYPGAAFSINAATGALTPVVGSAFDLTAFAQATGYSVAIVPLL